MEFLVRTWKGLVFIFAVAIINAFIWLGAAPLINQTIESQLGQIMASNILLTFTIVFFLSTKNRFVNWLFNGLENVYIYHRFLAIIGIIMIFIHAQFSHIIFQFFRPDLPIRPAIMGIWARNIFIFLIVFALLAKYMKYERWRVLHRFMIIPYLMGAYHATFLSSYDLLSFSLLGLWMQGMVILGISSSFYMIFLYRRTAFSYKAEVEDIQYLNQYVTELTIKLEKPYAFKYGQFTFIKIDRSPFNGVPHPFSISGGDNNKVTFTIKALGDFTRSLKDNLKIGDEIYLTKAFGHMTFKDFDSRQVWIAGGIGLTPFLSYLRDEDNIKNDITLYYSVKSIEDSIYLDQLKSLDSKHANFSFQLWESNIKGYLSIEQVDLRDNPTVFMCGPVNMARALKKQLKKTNKHDKLIYEAFSFTGTLASDIENLIKKFMNKNKNTSV